MQSYFCQNGEGKHSDMSYLQFCLKQLWFAMKTQNISQETLFVFGKHVIEIFLQMSLIMNISKSFPTCTAS